MHGRFSPATAIEMARMLQPFGLRFGRGAGAAGQPQGLEEGLRRHKRGQTVATGERIHQRLEYREVFELQAADVIQPDISHIGGLLETKKLAAWADAYYVTIAPHNVGGQMDTAAALHLAARDHDFRIQEYFNDFADPWVRETAPGLPEVVDGYFELPERDLASASNWTKR